MVASAKAGLQPATPRAARTLGRIGCGIPASARRWTKRASPATWECSWHAAWDLAFHRVVFAPINPASAKEQLVLLVRQWYMHPNGQLPVNEPGATSTRRRTLGRRGASIRWTARRMAGRAVHIGLPVAGGNGAEGREPLVRAQTLWCGAKLAGCCGLVGKHRRHGDCGG